MIRILRIQLNISLYQTNHYYRVRYIRTCFSAVIKKGSLEFHQSGCFDSGVSTIYSKCLPSLSSYIKLPTKPWFSTWRPDTKKSWLTENQHCVLFLMVAKLNYLHVYNILLKAVSAVMYNRARVALSE